MGNVYESTGIGPAIRMSGKNHCGDGCQWPDEANEGSCCEWNGASAAALRHDAAENETHVYYESCEHAKEVEVASECRDEENLGRVLDVTMTLRNVCPGRRSAVGVHLLELDDQGNEYARGFRSCTVPAHSAGCNRDVALPSMRFILPEDVSLASRGRRRHFVVRTTNHYLEEAVPSCGCTGCNS